MPRLEFVGKDVIRRNLDTVMARLRATYPNVSETGIVAMAQTQVVPIPPRLPQFVQCFFGRDILAEDPTQIEAWPFLTPDLRERILNTAAYLGEGATRETLLNVPLSKTYVWSVKTDWVQDVTAADADLLRRVEIPESQIAKGETPPRYWFRDIDQHGPFVPRRAFDLPVVSRETFTDPGEAKRYERDQRRKRQWAGS